MSKLAVIILACLMFLFGFAFAKLLRPAGPSHETGTSSPADSPPALAVAGPDLGITRENYPIVDGSTSTRPLGQLIMYRSLGLPAEMRRDPRQMPEWSVSPAFPLEVASLPPAVVGHLYQRTHHRGTHQAYEHLLGAGSKPAADIILVAREPSADELALAKKNNVELDARPMAKDAFIFMVNAKNSATNLSLAQIRDIYGGKIDSWEAVGGHKATIKAFVRNRNSGSQELMEKLVMKERKITRTDEGTVMTMMGAIDRITQEPDGLGYSVYYYERIMVNDPQCRLLAIDGVAPSAKTIADGSYPLATDVYIVTRKDLPADHPAAKLRDWLLSAEGQRVVADSGYVPIKLMKNEK